MSLFDQWILHLPAHRQLAALRLDRHLLSTARFQVLHEIAHS
jgi:hypothetical protein